MSVILLLAIFHQQWCIYYMSNLVFNATIWRWSFTRPSNVSRSLAPATAATRCIFRQNIFSLVFAAVYSGQFGRLQVPSLVWRAQQLFASKCATKSVVQIWLSCIQMFFKTLCRTVYIKITPSGFEPPSIIFGTNTRSVNHVKL